MKTLLHNLIIICLFILPQTILGQTNSGQENVIKQDPRMAQFKFVPGIVLVRLKDNVSTVLGKASAGVATMGIASVDAILQKYQVTSTNKLFPQAKILTRAKTIKSYNAKKLECPSLHNIYELTLTDNTKTVDLINELKNNTNVVYAEPDYIYSIVDDMPASPVMNEKEAEQWIAGNKPQNQKPATIQSLTPGDPFYSQQWGIAATQIDAVWASTTGDTTQIIAILDTGVDWKHPDLADNIWVNPNPNTMADANGVINDIRGWDYINNDNDPMDDNSHGTHVAGIAAAVGNNGIGIAGVNWHAKIMPIKVFQSDGTGDLATITKGIIYAASHGATVINMSWGSYAESMTMEAALENAYSNCVLVAAAGNDNIFIGPKPDCMYQPGNPFFPAALSFVLGVQADGSCGQGFSNYDGNPVYSGYAEMYNYELNAPGTGIISTIPDGNYRVYSGTSMAAPLVSGAVSLYKTLRPQDSQELMWGNLINTSGQYIQINSALNVKPKTALSFISSSITDTLSGDNANGLVDAGETIQLSLTIKNTWGQSDSVFAGLRLGEFEDTSIAHILNPISFVGSISAFALRTNESNPFVIQISPNAAHDRNINFEALLWYAGSTDTIRQQIQITANHAKYLPGGIIDSTIILTPDRQWFVSQSLKFSSNGGLIIQPGTTVYLTQSVAGIKSAVGTKDSLIQLFGNGNVTISGNKFQYCDIEKFIHVDGAFTNCTLNQISNPNSDQSGTITGTLRNCTVTNCNSYYSVLNCSSVLGSVFMNSHSLFYLVSGLDFEKNNIINCFSTYTGADIPSIMQYNNFVSTIGGAGGTNNVFFGAFFTDPSGISYLQKHNNIIQCSNMIEAPKGNDIIMLDSTYWGTSNQTTMRNSVYDFWDDVSRSMYNFGNYLTAPSDSAHGVVWKVLVDGVDPQDQASLMNPVGVGTHKFDVYFNRSMDTTYKPQLTFGVRSPYTQQAVADSGHWSDSAKVWTAYKNVKLYTGDGINTVRVSSAKDPEGFDIPVEDMRFSFLISAASSSSVDFTATAGLGKVNLEWTNPKQVVDLLGYNIYRFQKITDTTFTAPVTINSKLVTDTVYTDYNVTPNIKYYYYYKTVNTDFSQSDSSRIVSTTPYTASLGDANGDLTVNIMDVLSIVAYMLGQDPQPFILAAGDVNQDSVINILDVIGDVNLILHGTISKQLAKTTSGNASLDLSSNKLSLTSSAEVGGIEFILKGTGLKDLQFTQGSNLSSFEVASANSGDTSRVYLIYSMKGESLPKGTYVLGTFGGLDKGVEISSVIISDPKGQGIVTEIYNNGVPVIPKEYYISQNYPNPFNPTTTIQYGVPAQTKANIVIYNILGQRIRVFELGEVKPGRYQMIWDGRNNYGRTVASGVYIYRFESQKYSRALKMLFLK
ncbi:MAG: S8 family serine peptidase [Ignavibacteriaceae bacterium]|nr:S8 family serine peptidase [Ignavibacteriaceae bacterium]